MSSKVSKGIALLLFGILLCAGGGEINATILYNLGDFPFAAIVSFFRRRLCSI